MTDTACPVRIRLTRLEARSAEKKAGQSFIIPPIKIGMPPAPAAAYFRGISQREDIRACFVDCTSKGDEWVTAFEKAVGAALAGRPTHASLLICLRVNEAFGTEDSSADWLEVQPIAFNEADAADFAAPPEESGFTLWQPSVGEVVAGTGVAPEDEDNLARLLWRGNDYETRWHHNKGRYFYYSRNAEERQLNTCLNGAAPFALVGQSLAGKTRLLLRALAERRAAVLVARPDAMRWTFPAPLPKSVWVVFDDIDIFLTHPNFASDFAAFTAQHGRWAATCRSGEAYESLRAALPERAGESLSPLLVGRLNANEVERVAVQLHLAPRQEQHRQAPRNIGYYFLNEALNIWRNQYSQLPTQEKSALQATAAALRLGAGSSLDTVEEKYPRWLLGHGQPAKLSDDEFSAACAALALDPQAKSWWEYEKNNSRLRLEPVFIDEIIDPKGDLLAVDFVLKVLASQTAGIAFLATPQALARWLEQAVRPHGNGSRLELSHSAYEQLAPHLVRVLANGSGADAGRILLMLWCCADAEARRELPDLLGPLLKDHRPQMITLNLLLRDAERIDGDELQAFCRRLKLQPDEYTFTTLIEKATSDAERQRLFAQMQAAGVTPNVVTFNTLIEKATSDTERQRLFAQMQAAGVTPDVVTFNTLIEKATSDTERQRLFAQMQAAGVTPDVVTFTTLIEKATSDAERQRLFAQMQAAGVTPNVVTFTTLIEKATSDAERQRLFAQMQAAGVTPNVVTFNTLIEKATSDAERQRLFAQMQAAGVTPNVVTFNMLIKRATSLAAAEVLFAQMRSAGVPPDNYTLPALLKKAPNFATGRRLFEECRQAGLRKPNGHVWEALQHLARGPAEQEEAKALEMTNTRSSS